MRAFAGQMSDTKPISRTPQERVRLLAELKQALAAMKPQVSAELRASVKRRIGELERQAQEEAIAAQVRGDAAATRRETSPEARRAGRSPRAVQAF